MKIFIGIVLYKLKNVKESQCLDYERCIYSENKYTTGLKF